MIPLKVLIMKITILTLFPEYFSSLLQTSMLKRALAAGILTIHILDIRDFSQDKHSITDDRPFGGGAGMVLKVEPIDLALQSSGIQRYNPSLPVDLNLSRVVLTSAKGKKFTQETAIEYAKLTELVIICGHYEGVDERVAEHLIDEELRIGDYVLTGGEPAAAVIVDAVMRLLPDALGNAESIQGESHEVAGQLGYPTYTRPVEYYNWRVPEILLSGDHEKIARWRAEQRKQED